MNTSGNIEHPEDVVGWCQLCHTPYPGKEIITVTRKVYDSGAISSYILCDTCFDIYWYQGFSITVARIAELSGEEKLATEDMDVSK